MPLSRDNVRKRAEIARTSAENWESTVAERIRVASEAITDDERNIGEGIVAIGLVHLALQRWKAEQYDRLSRGLPIQPFTAPTIPPGRGEGPAERPSVASPLSRSDAGSTASKGGAS